jgi:protein-L-isoaspartate(D-aspartate) O-methyltransferase
MHAHALEALEPCLVPGARVLDVGSGSGYLLAASARLVAGGGRGRVVGVDHIPALVDWSRENLRKNPETAAWLDSGVISVRVGDGYAGAPDAAPFDAIHVGAAAPTIPPALVEQLAPGGRMVIPVGTYMQEFTEVDKDASGHVTTRRLVGVQFVPLTSRSEQEGRAMW